jgi:hypothetical protein
VLSATLVLAALVAQSRWVSLGPDGRLRYTADERGNRIIDFSHAGYGGGGVRIPAVRVARTLTPITGDNTARIQAAIDEVARLVPARDGFRGAVALGAGVYETAGTIVIAASGVVVRGGGSGAGGTTLRMTGRPHRLFDIRGAGTWQAEGDGARIADAYVPSGARSLRLASAAGFRAGDAVLVRRPVTEAWIRFMGMHTLVRDGKPQTWIKAGTAIAADRTVESVAGDTITIDAPLTDSYDAQFLDPPGATVVKYAFPGRIARVGVESLRIAAPGEDVPINQGQYTWLRLSAVSDAWARDVAVEETQNGVVIAPTARRVTLERVRIRHSVPHTSPAAPADIAISGTQVLIDRSSVSGKGVWPIVTQNGVTGPNVVLNFTCDEAGVSPHQRWATGLLVDGGEFRGNTERRPGIAFSNRSYAGSGHGWTVGWAVAWNVTSDWLLVQQPPGVMNWCIGCTGRRSSILWNGQPAEDLAPAATYESPGAAVDPASLYLQQLRDRLGPRALEHIGYGRRGSAR